MKTIGLLTSVFYRNWFHQPVVEIWVDEAFIRTLIEVEIALAKSQGELGLIPNDAAQMIESALQEASIDHERLAHEIANTMHPFVPLLRQLEEICGEHAAAYLHWGATTQNIVDTAMSLMMQRSHVLMMSGLDQVLSLLSDLALEHRNTPMAGRTHGQHALPITFGLKVAAWRGEVRRHRERLKFAAKDAFVASMGGAVGTFASMAGKGRAVQGRVAERLGLTANEIPVRSVYDQQVAYVSALSLLGASIEKIAGEVFTLQRTEIAEAAEGFHRGKVGSSTMAQKRNPGLVMNLGGLARLMRSKLPLVIEAMVRHDDGDGVANNICEVTLPEIACIAVSLTNGLANLLGGLNVDGEAMKSNLAMTDGLIVSEALMMALAKYIGRHHAHQVLYDVAQDTSEGKDSFETCLKRHPLVKPLLSDLNLRVLLDPTQYLGEASKCVEDELLRV